MRGTVTARAGGGPRLGQGARVFSPSGMKWSAYQTVPAGGLGVAGDLEHVLEGLLGFGQTLKRMG
jgi:hypothetical protein